MIHPEEISGGLIHHFLFSPSAPEEFCHVFFTACGFSLSLADSWSRVGQSELLHLCLPLAPRIPGFCIPLALQPAPTAICGFLWVEKCAKSTCQGANIPGS